MRIASFAGSRFPPPPPLNSITSITFAQLFCESDVIVVEDRVIQQFFGHADVRSVQAYARIEDATLRAEILA
jgi:hypothetical protein